MPYKVQFVGLAYFSEPSEAEGTRVLLPDGRRPPRGVPPHIASISVCPDAFEEDPVGWLEDEISADEYQVEFFFPPARITVSGMAERGKLEASQQHGFLPRLKDIYPDAIVDTRRAFADIVIRQGNFRAFRRPGSRDDGNAAVISELTMPYDDSITIQVQPFDEKSPVRTIRVKAGSEIAIINASRGGPLTSENGHFRIYEQLFVPSERAPLVAPQTPKGMAESKSRHPAFTAPQAAQGTRECSGVCCASDTTGG